MLFIPTDLVVEHKSNLPAQPSISSLAASSQSIATSIDEGHEQVTLGSDEAQSAEQRPSELYVKEAKEEILFMLQKEEIEKVKHRELHAFKLLKWGHFITFVT